MIVSTAHPYIFVVRACVGRCHRRSMYRTAGGILRCHGHDLHLLFVHASPAVPVFRQAPEEAHCKMPTPPEALGPGVVAPSPRPQSQSEFTRQQIRRDSSCSTFFRRYKKFARFQNARSRTPWALVVVQLRGGSATGGASLLHKRGV